MPFCRFYHVYPAHILRGHSIGAARTFARTLHGLDQICTDFARIHTDVHGRTDAALTLHGHFMVPGWTAPLLCSFSGTATRARTAGPEKMEAIPPLTARAADSGP